MLRKLLSLIFGFALLISFGWGIYFLLSKIVSIFLTINPVVSAGLLTASATLTVGIVAAYLTKYLEYRAALIKEHRDKKAPFYEELIEFLFKVFLAEKVNEEKPTEEDMIRFMTSFTQKLIVWGSDEVVQSYNKFRTFSIHNQAEDKTGFGLAFILEDLLLAIRKDLGHKNKNIKRGDLLSLFINDMPENLSQNMINTGVTVEKEKTIT